MPISSTWTPISRIYGMEKLTVKEQVLFQQRIYFASKQRMLWYADNISSFPLRRAQIERYYDPDEVGRIRGHLSKRKHQLKNVRDQSEDAEMKAYDIWNAQERVKDDSKRVHRREEIQNIVMGYETGSDIVPGPGNNSHRAVFVDNGHA